MRYMGFCVFIALTMSITALAGCGSVLKETYYVKAYDPQERATNFFRIKINGSSSSSRIKLSTGFYDRSAVERLFGENLLSREYLSTDVKLFDQNGSYNTDLETRLATARSQDDIALKDELRAIAATASERIAQMGTRIALSGNEPASAVTKLAEAATAVTAAETAMAAAPPQLIVAKNRLATALGIVRMVRTTLDGGTVVRFLDGAGNDINVSDQVQLIFVSTDSGRFTQALRDLVKSDKAQQQLVQVALGPKIIEAERIKARLVADTASTQARLASLNARNTEIKAATTVAQLRTLAIRAASEAAGAVTLTDPSDIRIYVEGL